MDLRWKTEEYTGRLKDLLKKLKNLFRDPEDDIQDESEDWSSSGEREADFTFPLYHPGDKLL